VTDEKREQQAASSPDVEADAHGPNGKAPAASPAPAVAPKRGGLAVLKVLRHREFAWFWGGQAISLVGTWMQNFAQSWVVTGITHTAMALGLVNFMLSIPTLLLMPLGGVAADRIERRKILIYTQWLMLVLALIMGALVAANRLQMWHVYVIAILSGVATAYELPSYQSFYPQLVEKEDLTQAISLNQATFHASRIIGPGLAAWFVALWGTAAAFYANAASFLFVIGGLLMIRPRPPANANKGGSAKNFMGEGFKYVKSRPELGSLLGITGITTLFIFPNLAVLMPFYAKHILATDAKGLGWIMAVSGFGSFIGAGMLLSVAPAARIRRMILCTATIMVTMSIIAWARSLTVVVAAAGVQSFAIAHSLGIASIMVQEEVPNELRGRVMSLYSLMFTGVMPFAALLITGLADAIGMRLELQGAGIIYGILAILLMLRLHRAHPASLPGEAHA